MYENVLSFWFKEIEPSSWWVKDAEFDGEVRRRFADVLGQAVKGELSAWRIEAKGRLAEIIVLDQFSRNIYRNTPQAFAQDGMALVLAQEAMSNGTLDSLNADERCFLLMPFMHSESKHIHGQAEVLFREYTPEQNHEFELKHKAIIDRFGRYPHRNDILARTSSSEEMEFLSQPGSSF